MVVLKDMEPQTDCQKCPFMATDGADTSLLSPMMCLALWATKHEVRHCTKGKILDDCPLKEIVTCKDCKHRKKVKDDWGYYCEYTNMVMDDDEFCSSGERKE